ncbi:MAG: hypothetical protein LBT11_03940, partial [Treponema sp.]|nr:hypothetical protein [Treponema sp.]
MVRYVLRRGPGPRIAGQPVICIVIFAVFAFCLSLQAAAQADLALASIPLSGESLSREGLAQGTGTANPKSYFPDIYRTEYINAQRAMMDSRPYGAPTWEELQVQ